MHLCHRNVIEEHVNENERICSPKRGKQAGSAHILTLFETY